MEVQAEWADTFFAGMFNDCWRQLRTDQNTRPETDFIERILTGAGPATGAAAAAGGAAGSATSAGTAASSGTGTRARILDVPCGGGRLGIELAARGHQVTGIDIQEVLLDEARAAAATRGVEAEWQRRDMRDLPWADTFDAAICFGISFGFLGDAGDQAFVRAVHTALKPGGRFIIDTNKVLEIVLSEFKPRSWAELGDIMMAYENEYDCAAGRLNQEYRFFRNGSSEIKRCSFRAYTYHELGQMLRDAGFSTSVGYGTLTQQPFRVGSQRLLLVATK